jgi:2-amino-4-hydroxy-6-hydroxymethyldihydropteridine diphosphokinase
MCDAVTAYVGLGANLGQAEQTVRNAISRIAQLPQTSLTKQSSLYRSAPVDAGGPDFINAVVEVSTSLTAPELLSQLQAIEFAAGRQRPYRNAPRTLDLDLLLFGDARIDSERLQVPHPRMKQRAFVLRPLAEIAPQRVPAASLDAVSGQRVERID